MNDMNSLWVLGHKIRLMDTDDSYGLIEVTSLPKVPGPPPHYHKTEKEFFFIVKGTLDERRRVEQNDRRRFCRSPTEYGAYIYQ